MRFKLDENLPVELMEELALLGHDADTVAAEGSTGEPDERIVEAAQSEDRILLTLDKGLADIKSYPPGSHAGIVLFRPASAGRETTLRFVRRHIGRLDPELVVERITVVTEAGIRRR